MEEEANIWTMCNRYGADAHNGVILSVPGWDKVLVAMGSNGVWFVVPEIPRDAVIALTVFVEWDISAYKYVYADGSFLSARIGVQKPWEDGNDDSVGSALNRWIDGHFAPFAEGPRKSGENQ